MHKCMCTCFVYTYMCLHLFGVCVHSCVCMFAFLCVHAFLHGRGGCVCVCVCVYVCVYVYMCICMQEVNKTVKGVLQSASGVVQAMLTDVSISL